MQRHCEGEERGEEEGADGPYFGYVSGRPLQRRPLLEYDGPASSRGNRSRHSSRGRQLQFQSRLRRPSTPFPMSSSGLWIPPVSVLPLPMALFASASASTSRLGLPPWPRRRPSASTLASHLDLGIGHSHLGLGVGLLPRPRCRPLSLFGIRVDLPTSWKLAEENQLQLPLLFLFHL